MKTIYQAEVEFVTVLFRTRKTLSFETKEHRIAFLASSEPNRFTVVSLSEVTVYLPGEAVAMIYEEHAAHTSIASGTINPEGGSWEEREAFAKTREATSVRQHSMEEVVNTLAGMPGVSLEGEEEEAPRTLADRWSEQERARRNRKDTVTRAGIKGD